MNREIAQGHLLRLVKSNEHVPEHPNQKAVDPLASRMNQG